MVQPGPSRGLVVQSKLLQNGCEIAGLVDGWMLRKTGLISVARTKCSVLIVMNLWRIDLLEEMRMC